MSDNIKDLVKKLKDNYLFQVSLGSKELFHSNLLAWLLEQKEKEKEKYVILAKFIKELTSLGILVAKDSDLFTDLKISRETQKFDLTISWKFEDTSNSIYIENKMKSIPTEDQLIKYDAKIENGVKLLLTPFKTKLEVKGWHNITYSDQIIKVLQEVKALNIKFENDDVNHVIERYIEFLQNLLQLINALNLDHGSNDLFLKQRYNFYPVTNGELLMKELKDLRLHDLILKLLHQKISESLLSKVSKIKELKIVDNINDLLNQKGNILITSGFTRSSGISDIKICVGNNILLCLQLQENTLKYGVEVFSKDLISKCKEYADILVENKLWFYDFDKNDPELLSGNGRNKKMYILGNENKKFNSYGDTFIYLNKDMSSYREKTIDDLTTFISNEVGKVYQDIDTLESLFPK
jgi:hypothetical protein